MSAGPLTPLARYVISSGERVVHGQRVDGVVRLVDKPAEGAGRSYLVERGLTSYAELQAIVADYVQQSVLRDEPAVLVRLGDAPVVRDDGSELAEVRHA